MTRSSPDEINNGRVPIELVREYLAYDPSTGAITWEKNRGQRGIKGMAAGSISNGYIAIGLGGVRSIPAHRIAFALMHGRWPSLEIDHIDGNKTNNEWGNLREVTTEQNHQNLRNARSDNKVGTLGVSMRDGRYLAQIQVRGKKHWIGQFNSQQEASEAYIKAKRELHSHGTL